MTSKIQISEVCDRSCDIQFKNYAVHINEDFL